MMEKLFVLFIFLILITGCSTEYNIKLRENSFSEEIIITVPSDFSDSRIDDFINRDVYPKTDNEKSIYNKEIVLKKDFKKIIFSYVYNDIDFNESSILQQCFESVNYINHDNYYLFHITGNFYCFERNDSVEVNVSTDGRVIDSNAKKVKGRTYSWEINKDNVNNVNIHLQVAKPIEDISKTKNIVSRVIIFMFIGSLGYYLYRRKFPN